MPLLKVINLRRRNNDDRNDSVSIRGGHRKVLADERYPEVPGVRGEALEIVGTDVIEGRFINEKLMTQLDASDGIVFGCATYMGFATRPYSFPWCR